LATPNCGDVVSDGRDGFLIPIRDPQALAERILGIARDPEGLRNLSVKAREKARQFSLGHLETRLLALEADLREA
jgi:glycosyltransferase involved in cell wall biosynthesis